MAYKRKVVLPPFWNKLCRVFTHVTCSYANLWEQKETFYIRKKIQLPQDWFRINTNSININTAAVSLFWETNMAGVTSCKKAP